MLLSILMLIPLLVAAVWLFIRQNAFGQIPTGARLLRIQQSPHYRNGQFQNLHPTPQLTEGATRGKLLWQFLFDGNSRRKPAQPLPSTKIDLHSLDRAQNVLVWFGHSSYFLQVDGRRFLVDPVFSGAASPLRFANPAFPGSDRYTPDDIPALDVLFITHDHWDHLDYTTVKALRPKAGQIITGLGTGAHLERWGFDTEKIVEKDWYERVDLGGGFVVDILPTRHFSGRGFRSNQSLWVAFALKTPTLNLYLGGDSGYDTHFAETGQRLGPFDLAILDCGQYNIYWKHVHTLPEEVVQAAQDLRAKRLLPVHWGKFAMSMHDWDEPVNRVKAAAAQAAMPLLLPTMGEAFALT